MHATRQTQNVESSQKNIVKRLRGVGRAGVRGGGGEAVGAEPASGGVPARAVRRRHRKVAVTPFFKRSRHWKNAILPPLCEDTASPLRA
eukprot:1178871-Prorocentrum_minimum.AAC.3